MNDSVLPPGWTIERVRQLEPAARLLDPSEHYVVADLPSAATYEELRPEAILAFGDLCLCLVPEEDSTAWWWMGHLDESDGSIICWSAYGDDLEHAIRSL